MHQKSFKPLKLVKEKYITIRKAAHYIGCDLRALNSWAGIPGSPIKFYKRAGGYLLNTNEIKSMVASGITIEPRTGPL